MNAQFTETKKKILIFLNLHVTPAEIFLFLLRWGKLLLQRILYIQTQRSCNVFTQIQTSIQYVQIIVINQEIKKTNIWYTVYRRIRINHSYQILTLYSSSESPPCKLPHEIILGTFDSIDKYKIVTHTSLNTAPEEFF